MDILEISDYFGSALEPIFPECKEEIHDLVKALNMSANENSRIATGEMDATVFKILKCMNENGVHKLIREI